jgi:pSer/pThr/pTyr-binding forkhead associated (FHA) protein
MSLTNILWIISTILAITAGILLINYLYLVFAPVRKPANQARYSEPIVRERTGSHRITGEHRIVQPQRQQADSEPLDDTDYEPTVPHGTDLGGLGYFKILDGLNSRDNIPLPAETFNIGRYSNQSKNVLLVLNDETVSREHAMMRCNIRSREFFIQDLNSTYGTFLLTTEGQTQLEPYREYQLYNNDVLQFGKVVRVQVHILTVSRSSITRLE